MNQLEKHLKEMFPVYKEILKVAVDLLMFPIHFDSVTFITNYRYWLRKSAKQCFFCKFGLPR